MRARNALRWTQAEAARRIRVAAGTYARWERAEQRPHPGQIRRLEEVFGRPAGELGFGLDDAGEPEPGTAPYRQASTTREEQQFDRLLEQVLEQAARLERRIREIPLSLAMRPSAVQDPGDIYTSRGQADAPLTSATSIRSLYESCGGRLLILGEPGAGKSAFLGDLLRELLDTPAGERRRALVLFHLSLWEPRARDLAHWLVGQLRDRYGVSEALGTTWVEQERIIPLLDGLDTVPDDRRDRCRRAIDAFLLERRGLPIVVACRTQEFEALGRPLALRAAVVVHSARRDALERYLAEPDLGSVRRLAGDDEAMWRLLATPLFLDFAVRTYGADGTAPRRRGAMDELRREVLGDYVRQQIAKPALRGAAAPYAPGPSLYWLGSLARGMLPERLFFVDWMQPRWLPSRWARELVLLAPTLGMLVVGPLVGVTVLLVQSAALRLGAVLLGGDGSYPIPIAGDFHGYRLAMELSSEPANVVALGVGAGLLLGACIGAFAYQRFIIPTDQLEWSWAELRQNVPTALTALTAALLLATLLGLVWWGLVVELAFITALILLVSTLMYERRSTGTPRDGGIDARTVRPLRRWLFPVLLASLLAGVLVAANALCLIQAFTANQLRYRIVSSLAIGLSAVVAFGFRARLYDRPMPGTGMEVSKRNALRAAWIGLLVAGIPLGIVDWISVALEHGWVAGLETGILDGLLLGMAVGVAIGLRRGGAAWLRHQLLWRLVVAYRILPPDLGPFLDDMSQRALLIRTADGYRFYHDVLQDHLAGLTADELELMAALPRPLT